MNPIEIELHRQREQQRRTDHRRLTAIFAECKTAAAVLHRHAAGLERLAARAARAGEAATERQRLVEAAGLRRVATVLTDAPEASPDGCLSLRQCWADAASPLRQAAPVSGDGALDRLSSISNFLDDIAHPLSAWLAESLAMIQLGAPVAIALNMGHGYTTHQRHRSRTVALLNLVQAQPAGLSVQAMARRIAKQLADYRVHRDRRGPPTGLDRHLFSYTQANGPQSSERIRKLLAAGLVKKDRDLTRVPP